MFHFFLWEETAARNVSFGKSCYRSFRKEVASNGMHLVKINILLRKKLKSTFGYFFKTAFLSELVIPEVTKEDGRGAARLGESCGLLPHPPFFLSLLSLSLTPPNPLLPVPIPFVPSGISMAACVFILSWLSCYFYFIVRWPFSVVLNTHCMLLWFIRKIWTILNAVAFWWSCDYIMIWYNYD